MKLSGKPKRSKPSRPVDSIFVCVRIRPRNTKEKEGTPDVLEMVDDTTICFDPAPTCNRAWSSDVKWQRRDLMRNRGPATNRDKTFCFDRVFGKEATQWEVYNNTARTIVESVLNGYNGTVFAYGATGSGKTYTMVGPNGARGVMVRTLNHIFKKINDSTDRQYNVQLSYIEIYNEEIHDLLEKQPGEKLQKMKLCETRTGAPTIPNLRVEEPKSTDEVFELLKLGNSRRSQAPTDQNKESSRSHAILQVTVKSKPLGPAINHELLTARLNLVDLAGSERCQKNIGKRLVEGSNINKSLLQLGNCINALASVGPKFVPYRNSKLTLFLKDSLGGSCKTVMICNVSPSRMSYNEVYQTLSYANRAKDIRVEPIKNQAMITYHYAQYQQMLAKSAKRQQELQTKLETVVEKLRCRERHWVEANAKIVQLQQSGQGEVASDSEKLEKFKSKLEAGNEKQIVTHISEKQSKIKSLSLEHKELSSKINIWEKVKSAHACPPSSPMLVTKQRANLRSKERDIKDLKIEIAHYRAELLTTLELKQVDCKNFFKKLATSQGKEQIMKTFDEWKSDLEKEQEPKPEKTEILLKNYFNLYVRSSESMGRIFQTLEQFYNHCRKLSVLTPELRLLFGTCRDIMTREDMVYDPTLTYSPCGIRRTEKLMVNRTPRSNVRRQIGFISPKNEDDSDHRPCESSPRMRTLSLESVSVEEKGGMRTPLSVDNSESNSKSMANLKKVKACSEGAVSGSSANTSIDTTPTKFSTMMDTNSRLYFFDRHLNELEKARRDLDVESNRSTAALTAKNRGKKMENLPNSQDVERGTQSLNEHKSISSARSDWDPTTMGKSRDCPFNPEARAYTPTSLQSQQLKTTKLSSFTGLTPNDKSVKDSRIVGSIVDRKYERSGNITPDICIGATASKEPLSLECTTPSTSNCQPKPGQTAASQPVSHMKNRRRSGISGSFSAPKLELKPKLPFQEKTRITIPKLNLNLVRSKSLRKSNSARISEAPKRKKNKGFSSSRLRRPSIFYKTHTERSLSTTCESDHRPCKKYKNLSGSPHYKRKRRKSLWGSMTLPLPESMANDMKARPKRKRRATTIMHRRITGNKPAQKPLLSRRDKKKRPPWA